MQRKIGQWLKRDNQPAKPPVRQRRRQPSQLAFAADHKASTVHSILQSLLTLYSLLMLMLGVVVPISDALAKPTEHADSRQLFYIFMNTVGMLGIMYMSALISCHRHKGEAATTHECSAELPEEQAGSVATTSAAAAASEAAADAEMELSAVPSASSRRRTRSRRLIGRLRKRMKLRPVCKLLRPRRRIAFGRNGQPKIMWSAVGVNLYLRFGAIIFGFGVMVHSGFKIVDVLRKRGSELCVGPWFLPKHVIDLLFITTQTYFLFKYHRVIINTKKSLVRFFLIHLAVANLCIWVKTVIYEIKAGIMHSAVKKLHKSGGNHSSYYAYPYGAGKLSNVSFDVSALMLQANNTAGSACTGHMLDDDAPSVKLGPYLYPCAVEYGLICAAICYKFFTNVGDTEATPYGVKLAPVGPRTTSCHKSHRGLFLGLIITICILVPMTSLLIMQRAEGSDHKDIHIIAMLVVECLVLCCTTAMALAGAAKAIRHLKPSKLEHHEAFDVNLLFVGLAGIICYNLFVSISVGSCLMMENNSNGSSVIGCQWGSARQSQITKLTGLKSLADVTQSVAQTLFVMQGIQRKVTKALVERMQKPGRGLTTALLIVNLAMWIGSVFEFQRDIGQDFLDYYFGVMPWSIIQFILQPLIIFYRFHSTVCLSEIWVHSYKLSKVHRR